ncbi:phytochelatin synthase family protein [bacterium]|nr:phytochelatin synthase family protein [bacterium]
MKNLLITLLCILSLNLSSCANKKIPSQVQANDTKPELIEFSSKEGMERFNRSKHKQDFFILSNHFESQTNKVYCGPTSAVIVLNGLRQDELRNNNIQLKVDKSLISNVNRKHLNSERVYVFNRYTYNNIYNVNNVKTSQQVLGGPMENGKSDWGYQLEQLVQLFKAHGLNADKFVVDDALSIQKMKATMIDSLNNNSNFILVNYKRTALGQKGGGHISPIGAYDKKSDSFLIMDVNPNKADWVWVDAKDLHAAMKTFDTIENRGYLMVSDIKAMYTN